MNHEHIVIADLPTEPKSQLYYYQGNFYYPLDVSRDVTMRVKNLIKLFISKNKPLVTADRAHLDYKNLVQLFEEQEKQFALEQ